MPRTPSPAAGAKRPADGRPAARPPAAARPSGTAHSDTCGIPTTLPHAEAGPQTWDSPSSRSIPSSSESHLRTAAGRERGNTCGLRLAHRRRRTGLTSPPGFMGTGEPGGSGGRRCRWRQRRPLIRDLGEPFGRAWRSLVDARGPKQGKRLRQGARAVQQRGLRDVCAFRKFCGTRSGNLLPVESPRS
jgi:hypothetical protein